MNILVTIPMDESQKDRLSAIAPEAEVVYCPADQLTPDLLAQAEIILGNLPTDMIPYAAKLKWLQLNFAGSDNYCTPGLLPEDVLLTNATGAYGLAISECMLAGILYHIKRLGQYHDQQRKHLWRNCGEVRSIEGSVTLVVGLGDIGSSFARRMNALGSTVFGIRRHVTEMPPYLAGLYTMDKLDELLPLADYVALSLPNSPATRNVMNAARFQRMKRDAILINVGRGSAVDTDALVEALNSERIGGAVIDVVHQEPLPENHPLWEAKNLLLTPHVTGNFNLPETQRRVVDIVLRNLAAYLHGGEMVSVVDRSTGYRKFS